ncbi:MAG: ABC transporter ATP-binding protein [Alphaproteobacteria bacterium]|nr:ABC transporter ATP-binding protein [Alphaproteobacteria bacterium]
MEDNESKKIESLSSPAIELIDINKRFGQLYANYNINLAIKSGTIHGIVGENGAGKSTLMNILYGYYQADSGIIKIDGKVTNLHNSHAAIQAGIGMVHQHFMLVDEFTVLENIILGNEKRFSLRSVYKKTTKILSDLMHQYQMPVPLDAYVGDLSLGLQQRVEILKAIYRGANILILDEPTSVLTPQETNNFFTILKNLKEQGKTILFITHKLREIMEITDNVTVMRKGEIIDTLITNTTTETKLAKLMVGRDVEFKSKTKNIPSSEILLSVKNLCLKDPSKRLLLDHINFTVKRREILGIAGIAGNGQTELLEVLAGMRYKHKSGDIIFRGKNIIDNSHEHPAHTRRYLGIGHIPENRSKVGLIGNFKAWESSILGYQDDPFINGAYFLYSKVAIDRFKRQIAKYNIWPSEPFLKTSVFSGGNQQKILLARELGRHPELLLVGHPTRGVDIGSSEFIYQQLFELRDSDKSVIVVSADLDELFFLADRIIVMLEGKIVGESYVQDTNKEKIGCLMAGIKENK